MILSFLNPYCSFSPAKRPVQFTVGNHATRLKPPGELVCGDEKRLRVKNI